MKSFTRLAASLLSCSVVSALPAGFSTFFVSPTGCPDGWYTPAEMTGRLIVSVTDGSISGLTVNNPLGDREDRAHTHSYAGNLGLPSKHIAADSCCDTQGGSAGNHSYTGTTHNGTSGVPLTQLYFCTLKANDSSFLPFGGVGYFAGEFTSCPAQWTPFTAAQGRFIVPGYIPTGGAPVTSTDPPLGNQVCGIT